MIARTLRELNNLCYLHRERARIRGGTSVLLGRTFVPEREEGAAAIDARAIPELRGVKVARNGAATVGAFTALADLAAAAPDLVPADASAANARMRLALHDARVTVLGLGQSRTAPLEGIAFEPYELPISIACRATAPGLGIAERRIATTQGDAQFALAVTIALRVSKLGRFEEARILADLDGDVRRIDAAEGHLRGHRWERERLAESARLAAASIDAVDARTSAIARNLQSLVLASLREAFDAAKRGGGSAAGSRR